MIYVTSDTHFGHEKVIELSNRPFKDVKEMTEEIIKRWNSVVRTNDDVYHLGDFAFWFKMEAGELQSIFNRLNGRKHLIVGNHDTKEIKALGWESVQDYKKIKHNKQKYVLCHYPIAEWDGFFNGTIHLYGHTHNNKFDLPNRIHVGMDTQDYTPVLLDDVGLLNGEITKKDERGVISVQNWKKGKLHGKSMVVTEEGDEHSTYEDGLLHGEFRLVGSHQTRRLIKNYKHGKLDGEYVKYHETNWGDDNVREIKAYYKDDMLHGEYIEYNTNQRQGNVGFATKIIVYENGVQVSEDMLGNKTSMIKLTIPLDNDRTEVREYHNKGDVKMLYELDNCGRKDGQFKRWFANGNLMQDIMYVKNRKNGKAVIYDKHMYYDHKVHKTEELNYVNNKKQGLQKTFKSKDSYNMDEVCIASEYYTVDDKYHGKYTTYDKDGDIECQGKYVNGIRRGIFTHPQNDIDRKYTYHNDKGVRFDSVRSMDDMESINKTTYDAWKNGDKKMVQELAKIHQLVVVEEDYFILTEKD